MCMRDGAEGEMRAAILAQVYRGRTRGRFPAPVVDRVERAAFGTFVAFHLPGMSCEKAAGLLSYHLFGHMLEPITANL